MKLLFDQNLSPLLVDRLEDIFPDSTHVFPIGMDRSLDLEIWQFSGEQGFVIVTRDSDFSDLSVMRGSPPKVLWIRRGNCPTHEIEEILRHGSRPKSFKTLLPFRLLSSLRAGGKRERATLVRALPPLRSRPYFTLDDLVFGARRV